MLMKSGSGSLNLRHPIEINYNCKPEINSDNWPEQLFEFYRRPTLSQGDSLGKKAILVKDA